MRGTQKRKIWQTLLMLLPMMVLCAFFCKTDVMAATKNHTMKAGTKYNIKNADYDTTTYHKIVVPSAGRIKVTGWGKNSAGSTAKQSMIIRLYNSNKKALEDKYTSVVWQGNSYTNYYGVKKGTYYIKVTGNKYYSLKYTFTKVTDKSGSSKAKALNMKRNTKYTGLLTAGEAGSRADWHKFTLSKRQNINIYYGFKANDWLRIQVYTASGRRLANTASYCVDTGFYGTLNAGTYYIKVSRDQNTKATNGYYYLRWK